MNEIIRRLRIHKGWTQRELARRAGVQQSTICRIEADCTNTSWITILKILIALKINVEKLYRNFNNYQIDKTYDFLAFLLNNNDVRKQINANPQLVAQKIINALFSER